MPLPRRDFLEFLFNGGRGLKMEQIDGVQTHLTSTGWDNVDDPQHLIIGPTMASVPDQMLLFFRLPFVIPRTTRNLTARIGAQNRELPVVGIDGGTIKPRDLTPGALHGMLIDTGGARFVEVIPPRPQDFEVVMAWLPEVPINNQAVFEAYVDIPGNHGVSMTPDVRPAGVYGRGWQGARVLRGLGCRRMRRTSAGFSCSSRGCRLAEDQRGLRHGTDGALWGRRTSGGHSAVAGLPPSLACIGWRSFRIRKGLTMDYDDLPPATLADLRRDGTAFVLIAQCPKREVDPVTGEERDGPVERTDDAGANVGAPRMAEGDDVRLIRMVVLAAAVLVALAVPAPAQDYPTFFSDAASRGANMQILVWDPDRMVENADGTMSPAPAYVAMPLTTLLAGLVTFPDTYVRYANVIEFDATDTTFDASDFPSTGVGVGAAGSLVVQMPGPPSGAVLVRYIMAIPVDAGDPAFVAVQPANAGFNSIANWTKQTDTVMLGTPPVAYNVWYRRTAASLVTSFTLYLFLDITAQP